MCLRMVLYVGVLLSNRLCLLLRVMFLEKFLLWKVFPLRCLRWILQFAVFHCPPSGDNLQKNESNNGLLDVVQRVIAVWSKQEFVQSAPLEQQVCILFQAASMPITCGIC